MGRGAELARARQAVARASVGTGHAVLITGEPGIGKTTLAREVLRLAGARAFQVLEGRCDALSGNLSYSPIVEAVGRTLRDLPVNERASIVDGLSVLGRLLPGLDLPADEPIGDAALDRNQALRGHPARV